MILPYGSTGIFCSAFYSSDLFSLCRNGMYNKRYKQCNKRRISKYAYPFLTTVIRPNCAMANARNVKIAVKTAFLPRCPCAFFAELSIRRSTAFTQRVTIPEIIFTAVEIAPRMISREMIGVRIPRLHRSGPVPASVPMQMPVHLHMQWQEVRGWKAPLHRSYIQTSRSLLC